MTWRAMTRHGWAFAAVVLAVSSCEGGPSDAARADVPRPIGVALRGGSVVLDAQTMVAFACDVDNAAVHAVDLVTGGVVTSRLDGTPAQLVRIPARAGEETDHLAVTLRDRNRVALLVREPSGQLGVVASVEVPPDPWGIAATPDGEILVTSTARSVRAQYGRRLRSRMQRRSRRRRTGCSFRT